MISSIFNSLYIFRLLSEAANHIFRQAKERVYRIAPRTARRPVVDSDSAAEKFSQSIYKSLKLDREIVPMLGE